MMKLDLKFNRNTIGSDIESGLTMTLISIFGNPANTKTTVGMRQANSSTEKRIYYC